MPKRKPNAFMAARNKANKLKKDKFTYETSECVKTYYRHESKISPKMAFYSLTPPCKKKKKKSKK